jgi:hypothetical protein
MAQDLDFSQYSADIRWLGNELLQKYPWIPVLDPRSDDLVAAYDIAVAALIAAVPLDIGTTENKRNDPRRQIDEYDDWRSVSAKLFTLRRSSFEMRQWLGNHYHQHTGSDDDSDNFVEWFRMIDVSWVLFVNQYTRDAVGSLVPWITVPYDVKPWNVLVFAKEQAHTFFLSSWQFQWVLATTFDEKDLHSAKLWFS